MRYGVSKIHKHKDLKAEREFQNIYNLLQSWKITGDDIVAESVAREVKVWMDKLLRLTEKLEFIHIGRGDPLNNEVAPVGHVFLRTDGGASTTLYVKESGVDATGWVAK